MRKAAFLFVSLAAIACMKKADDGTYRVTNPIATDTAKARDNAAKSGEQMKKKADQINNSEAVQKIKAGSKELGKGVEEGLGQAAQAAGAKLQQVGKKAEENAKKPNTTTTE